MQFCRAGAGGRVSEGAQGMDPRVQGALRDQVPDFGLFPFGAT